MNNFEAKYIKLSKQYLQEKMQQLKIDTKKDVALGKKESKLHKIMHGFFK